MNPLRTETVLVCGKREFQFQALVMGGGGEEKSSKINIAKKHDRVVIISCKILIVNTRSNAKIYDVQRADDVGNIAADLLSFPVLRSVFRQRPLEMKTWR